MTRTTPVSGSPAPCLPACPILRVVSGQKSAHLERLERLELSYEATAGLPVGFHPPPFSTLAANLTAPVLDLVDPYAARADDDHVGVEATDHQETPYGHVFIRQSTSRVGNE
jgi:hypothetical protein